MKDSKKRVRLDQANRVLSTFDRFDRYVTLSVDERGRIWVSWIYHGTGSTLKSKAWVTRESDLHPVWRGPWGGTESIAISQLVRWIQGKPVFPMSTWKYWASATVKLSNDQTLAVLREIGWPTEAICVLCKKPCRGLDWWSLNGVSGPCCSGWNTAGCMQKQRTM